MTNIGTAEWIYMTNNGKSPEEFVNPYIMWKMIDCRHITHEYDVVFIPGSLSIESDVLAYAPRRLDRSLSGHINARKYGDDWYWETTGSQWDRDLFNCVQNNKAPGM